MRVFNPLISAMIVAVAWTGTGAIQAAAKPKVSAAQKQLQAQLQAVTAERDDLKDRLAATESLQEDLAASQKSRDMARQETDSVRKELEQMKNTLAENQGSSDTILAELQKAKADLAASLAANEALRTTLAADKEKQAAPTLEGALVPIGPDILPARPLNLNRITPKARKVNSGVVVVNVLVSENGEVLDTRLLQGLPGQGEWVDKANAACVEQAKRIVFDPARTADGKTKVRVWQGVGFLLD
jgi:seryl-tRNA synthetase